MVKGPDAEGTGALSDDGFLVRRGSLCRKEMVESARGQVESARAPLIASGVLGEQNEAQLVFSEDCLFRTPSGAAMTILGRTSNGWADWKAADGRTLHEVKRQEPTSEPS